MIRYRSLRIIACVISLAIAAAEDYDGFDENENHEQYLDELEAEERALFTKFDSNGDGTWSRNEVRELLIHEHYKNPASEYYEEEEEEEEEDDDDEIISHDEMMERFIDIHFDRSVTDKDGDGKLSESEVKLALAKHVESTGEVDAIFDSYDTNGDGKVTFEEYFDPIRADDEIDAIPMGDDYSFERDEDDELEEF
eukprot:CAMPEP_0172520250 /NCGR_PEP_ID=MMETSP1066-20121228/291896_1 /TAXON_ID=671091 /ORGANISM="Coscinodiscus wailesii, Strain CCMP2513" /LENGTH=195 /DNA_ID=CAMNT_0013302979 /DNA_START=49 /DNA_END=636 /DNA_ORIENTATION=-